MGKRLDGTSMFTGINAGFTNAFAQLSGQYSDGITLENLNKALTNTAITSTTYGTTFASYMTNNFNSIDTDKDGVISATEIQDLMGKMAAQGLTREQITALAGSSGLTSLQETVLSHFDDIDKNHDGKVTNQEIQAYGVESSLEERKNADTTNMIKQMSTFYDSSSSVSDASLLDYKYLSSSSSNSKSET